MVSEYERQVLDSAIRRVPDFPKKGILFYDITTLLLNPDIFSLAVEIMARCLENISFDKIISIESRGFIFGATLAYKLKKGLVLVRKEGKLPSSSISTSYGLEYGTATVEMHGDAIKSGERIVVIDDLLATGGTAKAACELSEKLGGKPLMCLFLIELEELRGREMLKPVQVESILKYR